MMQTPPRRENQPLITPAYMELTCISSDNGHHAGFDYYLYHLALIEIETPVTP